jgi:hypothetical protein
VDLFTILCSVQFVYITQSWLLQLNIQCLIRQCKSLNLVFLFQNCFGYFRILWIFIWVLALACDYVPYFLAFELRASRLLGKCSTSESLY